MTPSPMVDLRDVFTYVDHHADRFVARLIDYVRHPSISSYGEGMDECASYIAEVMRQMGLSVGGGYSGPGSKTVLPHEAVAKCDIRLVEAQRAEDILEKVKAQIRCAFLPGN